MKKWQIVLIILILLSGCAKSDEVDTTKDLEEQVEELMATMSIEQKVGQIFFIRPDALTTTPASEQHDAKAKGVTEVNEEVAYLYEQYPCGGFAIFGKNIENEDQLIKLTTALHALGYIKPLICIDEEGGVVARLANNENFDLPKFPSNQEIAEGGDVDKAYELGFTIGGYLEKYGIDIDFAPVSDVNTNPDNPVIGSRAFGSDPELAAEYVRAVVKGLHDAGTYSCLKHFPGHGDTSTDTHTGYAETLKTWDELLNCEMIPFIAGKEEGSELIMSAHIATPNITGNSLPATLNYEILTTKLRNELGYDGLIITDSLAMEAINEGYSSGDAAIAAFKAGADILLMPTNYFEAYDAVKAAIYNGDISLERLDESVYRILKLKLQ